MEFKDMDDLNSVEGVAGFFDDLQPADSETMKDLVASALEYGAEKDKVKELKASLKIRTAELRDKELALFDMFCAVGIESIKAKGRPFHTKVDTYASVVAGSKDDAFNWIKMIGCDFLIEETVNAKSLTREIKIYVEDGGDIPDESQGIKIRTENRVVARKE